MNKIYLTRKEEKTKIESHKQQPTKNLIVVKCKLTVAGKEVILSKISWKPPRATMTSWSTMPSTIISR